MTRSAHIPDLRLRKETALSVALLLFPLPYIILALTHGDQSLYRIAQAISITLLLLSTLTQKPKEGPSTIFKILCFVIVTNLAMTTLNAARSPTYVDLRAATLKALYFLLILYCFDRIRHLTMSYIMERLQPLCGLLIVITTLHLLWSPVEIFGRPQYFGMHPNLGGETLAVCAATSLFAKSRRSSALLISLALFSAAMLQSRSATLAILIVLLYFPLLTFQNLNVQYAAVIVLAFASTSVAILILYTIQQEALGNIIFQSVDSLFLLSDPNRGLGSGFSGRDDTWDYAISVFLDSPIFGLGMDSSVATQDGIRVHSAPFILLMEFGVVGIPILWIMFLSPFRPSIMSDGRRLLFTLSSIAILLFQARSININIFPLLYWISLIPWRRNIAN